MPDENLQEVGAQLHEVLDEVLTEATAGWAQLASELAEALSEAAPKHALLQRAEVKRLLAR